MLSALQPIRTPFTEPAPARRRVLLSAFACAAQGGSEVGIGWNVARQLARFHDITVLCTPRTGNEDFRARNDRYLRDHGPIAGLTLHYVDPPPASRLLQQGHMAFLKPFYYAGYASWQRAALREARRLHAIEAFDIVHQLNMTGYREPGYLWRLDAPFVWGPIGGAADFPWQYRSQLGARERLFYGLRNVANAWQRRFARRPRSAARRAQRLWAIGIENQRLIESRWRGHAELITESGFDPDEMPSSRPLYDGSRPLRIVWSGLHIGRKALPLLLRAVARLAPDLDWELTVIGDGPERARWQRLADSLGVSPRTRWTGSLLHEQAKAELGSGDVLAFTSLQEGTPLTVLEALGLGLPVICHNNCGMGVAVDETCGFRVAPAGVEASVDGFARAIALLARDPNRLRDLATGAMRRANELSWAAQASRFAIAYEQVIREAVR